MKNNCTIVLLMSIIPFQMVAQETIGGISSELSESSTSNLTRGNCDTVFSFSVEGLLPTGLTFDGSYFYTGSILRHLIYKFDPHGQLVDSIPYPGKLSTGGEMDFDGIFLWVVVEQEGRVYKVDPTNGDTILSFQLPSAGLVEGDPDNYGCAYDHGYIWISEYFDKTLIRIDASTGVLIDSFAIGRIILPLKMLNDNLYGIEYSGHSAEADVQLVRFDKSTGDVTDSIPWCLEYPLGLTWADNHVWGLSSWAGYGTERIYQFENLLSSIDKTISYIHPVAVFPNPASDKVTIMSSAHINLIEMFNVMGERVFMTYGLYEANPYDIDIAGFQRGVYFLRIFEDGVAHIQKIVVQ